jgi:L-alanine-DL-glutamate epimerase-like enolase superfamily enzyme
MARIDSLELVPYRLPFREAYVTGRGRLEGRELVLVRLRSDDGIVGLGEAAPLVLRGGPGLTTLVAQLEGCGSALRGLEMATEGTDAALAAISTGLDRCRGTGASAQALSAIDLALHDLAAKLLEQPVWRLLGATHAAPVSCNATLAIGEPQSVARRAFDWATRGFSTFKLKLGSDAERDRLQVSAVRDAVGGEARIRVDANGIWEAAEAVERLADIESVGIELAEQPAPGLEDLAAVRRQTSIPVAADESVVSADDARRANELGACDLATVKLAKAGGIRASLAVAQEVPTYLSSALDGPVGIAAAVHVAQVLPQSGPAAGLAHGLATSELFAADIASTGCLLSGSDLHLPGGFGLGVDIDDRALELHRL